MPEFSGSVKSKFVAVGRSQVAPAERVRRFTCTESSAFREESVTEIFFSTESCTFTRLLPFTVSCSTEILFAEDFAELETATADELAADEEDSAAVFADEELEAAADETAFAEEELCTELDDAAADDEELFPAAEDEEPAPVSFQRTVQTASITFLAFRTTSRTESAPRTAIAESAPIFGPSAGSTGSLSAARYREKPSASARESTTSVSAEDLRVMNAVCEESDSESVSQLSKEMKDRDGVSVPGAVEELSLHAKSSAERIAARISRNRIQTP